jgi:hypothetical protein
MHRGLVSTLAIGIDDTADSRDRAGPFIKPCAFGAPHYCRSPQAQELFWTGSKKVLDKGSTQLMTRSIPDGTLIPRGGSPGARPLAHPGGAGLLWAIQGGRLAELHRDWAVIELAANGSRRVFERRRVNAGNVTLPWIE